MHFAKRKKPIALMLALALAASALLAGCGGQKQQAAGGAAQVKAMKVLQQDTPVVSEYAGQIAGKDEVKVQSKVSGRVVEKYFHGGDFGSRRSAARARRDGRPARWGLRCG